MTLRLGQIAPDFEQDTANGSIRFHPWIGKAWGMLFSYPRDFMPVVVDELVEVARLKLEWDRRAVADLYDMEHCQAQPEATASCLFLIDPHMRVRLVLTHPPGVARNFRDLLRVIDSLQATDVPEDVMQPGR